MRIIVDPKGNFRKKIQKWVDIIGAETKRMPKDLARGIKRRYLNKIKPYDFGGAPPSINNKTVTINTNQNRKTATLRVLAPHSVYIEQGVKPHFVGLIVRKGNVVDVHPNSKNPAQVSRLSEWVNLKARRLIPAIKKSGGLVVGSPNSKGALGSHMRVGGGPLERSRKEGIADANKRLMRMARKLK